MRAQPFGFCACRQGRDACNCGLMGSIKPIEQDLPINARTLAIALAAVALACFLSSLFPWGIA